MKNGDYILVKAPDEYPGKKYRDRYVYEHHLVWWENTGEIIDVETHLLHHKNEDKHDNSFDNLSKMEKGTHSRQHQPEAEMINLTCDWCSNGFTREARIHRFGEKQGYRHAFCSRSHQVKYQQKYQR